MKRQRWRAFLRWPAGVFPEPGRTSGLGFVKLKDWDLRPGANLKVDALVKRAMAKFSKIRNAQVFAFPPPAVLELGRAGGFDFELQDRAGLGHEALMAARNQLLALAAKDPRLVRVRASGLDDVTQYRVDVDWEKAGALGVPISAIHNTISAAFGSAYVNDFIQGGRVKRVYVQADAPYRMLPKDLERLYVRNDSGTMTPFASFATGHWFFGPPILERFNSFPALNIWGEPAPGRSSGEAMQAMEEIVAKLPKGIGYDWSRTVLPGAHGQVPGADALRLFHSRDFPVRGGPVRELDHSRGQPADVAPGFVRRDRGHVVARSAQRCLLSDRHVSPLSGFPPKTPS